jgi:MFS transporter, AAHS family, 4-hydroxybenzoate transporter
MDEVNNVTPQAAGLDIVEVLQSRRVGRFQIVTFLLCLLILFVDGLDYSAANVAAPSILRAFHADNDAMAAVFASGYFGIFVGSVAFGYIGDRFGRKLGAVLGVLAYSLPALLTVFASSLTEIAIFRCLAGLGIGGVMPNIVALLTETAPKRARMTFVMAAFIGYSLGNATIGQVAAWLIPQFGWSVPFLVAGVSGVVLSAVLVFALPESIPFLAATRRDSPQLRKLIARAAPDLALPPETQFTTPPQEHTARFSLALLFSGSRRIATTLLWLAFFAEALTYMTLTAWLPVLLERAGLAPMQASLAYSYAQLGAIVAILLVARLLDRFGPRAAVLSATAAVAAVVALGTQGLSVIGLTLIAVAAVACGSATHQSLLGIVGTFYPTTIRGNGIGYASGMGRIAAIIGPAAAGYLLSRLPLAYVLLSIAIPDLVVAAACIALDRCARGRVDGASSLPTTEQLAKTA